MKRVLGVVLLGALAVFFFAQGAIAQVSMTLTGPPPGNTYDGIYMSPYYATVGGSTNVSVVCDDFGDNTSIGDHWTATPSAFPTSTTSLPATSWGMAGKTTAQYDEVAWLTLQLLSLPSSVQPANALTLQVEDSFAIWAVFDPTGVASYLNSNPLSTNTALCTYIFGSAGCTGASSSVGGLLAMASMAPVPSGGYSMEIFSPDSGGSVCKAGGDACPAQEFIAMVPEGGAAFAYLFLAGLCCFGAIYSRSRRHGNSLESA